MARLADHDVGTRRGHDPQGAYRFDIASVVKMDVEHGRAARSGALHIEHCGVVHFHFHGWIAVGDLPLEHEHKHAHEHDHPGGDWQPAPGPLPPDEAAKPAGLV